MGGGSTTASVSVHGSGSTGGFQRISPTGGAAYGIPRYENTPSASKPSTGPVWVWTARVRGSLTLSLLVLQAEAMTPQNNATSKRDGFMIKLS